MEFCKNVKKEFNFIAEKELLKENLKVLYNWKILFYKSSKNKRLCLKEF